MAFRIHEADDLLRMVNQASFSGAVLYGDLEGGAYDEASARLVVVASASLAGDSGPVRT